MNDDQVAKWLADGAGRVLMLLRDGGLEPVPLGFVADQTANAFLMSALKMLRPDDAVLSEESPDNLDRLKERRVWIVDPLDGTREYMQGRSDWAVHVALTQDGVPIAGAVAQPAADRTFATHATPPRPRTDRRPVMLVSRTRRPDGAEALAAALDAEVRELGSAGAKAMAVVAGEADIYFHTGGQHEWDNCAPVAVALAAGLMACRIDGAPISYNQADVKVPDLLIAEPETGRRALAALRGR